MAQVFSKAAVCHCLVYITASISVFNKSAWGHMLVTFGYCDRDEKGRGWQSTTVDRAHLEGARMLPPGISHHPHHRASRTDGEADKNIIASCTGDNSFQPSVCFTAGVGASHFKAIW